MSAPASTLPPAPQNVVDLRFDPRNPRLLGEGGAELDQEGIFEVLWRDFAVDEVVSSIAANGYFPYEPVFAVQEPEGLTVVEGNRRLAAVKALLGYGDRSIVGSLPDIDDERRVQIEQIPTVISTRAQIWEYLGFKHVNGPQVWQSASKAEYIGWVHNDLGIPLDEIARRIGDKHATVQRLYRALMVIEQAEDRDVFQRSDRWKGHFSFSHLYTGLDYQGIQKFVQVKPATDDTRTPVPDDHIEQLGQLCLWLYGSRSRQAPPIVESQNPDLRRLDEVLQTQNGIAALSRGLSLGVSLEISRGDERVLREALIAARQNLQTARGKLLTGYKGETDLIKIAEDIYELADAIADELRRLRRGNRSRARRERTDLDEAGEE